MSATAVALFRQYIEQQRHRGRTHAHLSPQSLDLLGQLKSNATSRLKAADEAAHAALASPAPDHAALQHAAENATAPALIPVDGATVAQKLAHLATLAEQAPAARALGTLRPTMVFAVGNPEAKLMLVGEAPGAQEERQREPFVGPAGEKLTQILKAMGLRRADVYISNICKFRPAIGLPDGDQGTRNRKPTSVEMRACLPFILTEIDLIRPQCIIALGATAAEGLGLEGTVGGLRGHTHHVSGIPTLVTYHPSYVLREEQTGGGMRTKRQVWEDMLAAMEILNMSISDKQRSHFLPK